MRLLLIFFSALTFLCYGFTIEASVCLNMIIKNESSVIERCLETVKPLIDYWVIVDTGSTDGTQDIVKAFMKDVPGELHERPWENFAHNRNEALNLARDKSDYILFIDADEVFEFDRDYKFPSLNKDCYYIHTKYSGLHYDRLRLVSNAASCQWVGSLHEVLTFNTPPSSDALEGIVNIVYTDGARSKNPKKFDDDAALLENEVVKNPNETRTRFYLAQSYKDAGNIPEAIKNYQIRVAMQGWDQEVYWSLLQIAILNELLQKPAEEILESYFKAFHFRPSRAEPLYYLAKWYRIKGDYATSYSLSKIALAMPYPDERLFLEGWIYEYGLKLENSIAAYWLGKYEECKTLSEEILNQTIPQNVRDCVEKNLQFAKEKLNNSYTKGSN